MNPPGFTYIQAYTTICPAFGVHKVLHVGAGHALRMDVALDEGTTAV